MNEYINRKKQGFNEHFNTKHITMLQEKQHNCKQIRAIHQMVKILAGLHEEEEENRKKK